MRSRYCAASPDIELNGAGWRADSGSDPPGEFHQSARDYSNGTSSNATMLMILINGLIAGPAVSL